MKLKQKLVAAVMAVMLSISATPTAFAASDIDSHWGREYIQYLSDNEIYRPNSTTGDYEPDRDMTRAEFMRYINRAFNFTKTAAISYDDVKSNAWYYETIQIAEYYGYINGVGDNKMDPDGTVTREQAAVLLGRLFQVEAENIAPAALDFTDKATVSTWSAGYIKAAVDNGFLGGYADGSFKPTNVVTRAETAKLMYYYMGTLLNEPNKTYTSGNLKTDVDNVTISAGCTLSSATINGDLYITEGVGSDEVILMNVTVYGNLIVSGGAVKTQNVTCDHMIIHAG